MQDSFCDAMFSLMIIPLQSTLFTICWFADHIHLIATHLCTVPVEYLSAKEPSLVTILYLPIPVSKNYARKFLL